MGCRVCFVLVVFALAVRRRALPLFLFDIEASNCNLPRDRLVSVSSGECKMYRHLLGTVVYFDLYGSASSVHYVIYISWCLIFVFFSVTCLEGQ